MRRQSRCPLSSMKGVITMPSSSMTVGTVSFDTEYDSLSALTSAAEAIIDLEKSVTVAKQLLHNAISQRLEQSASVLVGLMPTI